MKLLFDQNISFKVVKKLGVVFPDAKHISDVGHANSNDSQIWEYARVNDFCIVTFDSDFIDISALKGFPPKIIWLRIGNTSTDNITERLINDSAVIIEFLNAPDMAFLEIK